MTKMPPLPSPTTSGRPPSTQRLPNAARASTAASQARAGTPKSQQSSNGIQPKSTRIRGGSDKDSVGSSSTRHAARRGSVAHLAGREKPPSKDGTVQRGAKEVEGLKDFVSHRMLLYADDSGYDMFCWSLHTFNGCLFHLHEM